MSIRSLTSKDIATHLEETAAAVETSTYPELIITSPLSNDDVSVCGYDGDRNRALASARASEPGSEPAPVGDAIRSETRDIRGVVRTIEDAGLGGCCCCVVAEAALAYYGASRLMFVCWIYIHDIYIYIYKRCYMLQFTTCENKYILLLSIFFQ